MSILFDMIAGLISSMLADLLPKWLQWVLLAVSAIFLGLLALVYFLPRLAT